MHTKNLKVKISFLARSLDFQGLDLYKNDTMFYYCADYETQKEKRSSLLSLLMVCFPTLLIENAWNVIYDANCASKCVLLNVKHRPNTKDTFITVLRAVSPSVSPYFCFHLSLSHCRLHRKTKKQIIFFWIVLNWSL